MTSRSFLELAAESLRVPVEGGRVAVRPGKRTNFELLTIDLPRSGSCWLVIEAAFVPNGNPYADFSLLIGTQTIAHKRFSLFCEHWVVELPQASDQAASAQLCVSTFWVGLEITSISCTSIQPDISPASPPATSVPPSLAGIEERIDYTALTLIELDELDQDRDEISAAGLDPAAVKSLFSRSITAGQENDWAAREPIVDVSLKNSFLTGAFGEVPSPTGAGRRVKAQMAIPLPSRVVASFAYEYFDDFAFILFTDVSFVGSVGCILFPDHDLLIYDRNYWSSSWRRFDELIGQYIEILNSRGEEIEKMRGHLDKPLIITKTCKNMGHFFYNELCGVLAFQEGIQSGDVYPVAELHDSWINCADYLSDKQFEVESIAVNELLDRVLADGVFPVRTTASRIEDRHAAHIGARALEVFKRDDPDRYKAFSDLSLSHEILFVNLRAHNKSWDRQVDGTAQFILEYKRRIQKPLAVYFDGFDDCQDVYDSIVELVDGDVTCVDGLSVSMSETLVWSYHCSFFIAVIGSGLVPLTWLGDRPGICYAEVQHMKQMSFWPLVRELKAPLYHPALDTITQDRDAMYSNFDFPNSELVRLLDEHFGSS